MDIASELGLNVAIIDSEESNPDREEFSHLHYGRNEEGLLLGTRYPAPQISSRSSAQT